MAMRMALSITLFNVGHVNRHSLSDCHFQHKTTKVLFHTPPNRKNIDELVKLYILSTGAMVVALHVTKDTCKVYLDVARLVLCLHG